MSRSIIVKLEGKEELEQKLRQLSRDLRGEAALKAVNAGAAVIVHKTPIYMDKKLHARSGNLRNSVSAAGEITGTGAKSTITVGQKYAHIHEYGGTIVPKNGKMLRWQGPDGKYIFAKKVRIPERSYLRPAIKDNQEEILNKMSAQIENYLEGAGG